MPFEIPDSWVWTTIGEIASSILYGVSESAKEIGQYKLLRITDIQNNNVNWDTVPFANYDEKKARAYLLSDGDVLFARTGATVGKSYLVEGLKECAIYASYLIRVQTSSVILPTYLKYFFESGFYWEQISLNSVGIGQPNVNGTTLAALAIPIPPYKEQIRIVREAKSWSSIIDSLDIEKEELSKYIDCVKTKILDLAILGKLAPQDPSDEPAIELLRRIKPTFTPCDNAHYPNTIPNSWTWTRLESISSDSADGPFGSNLKKVHYTTRKEVRIIQLSNIGEDGWREDNTKYTTFEHLKEISRSEVLPNDIVIAKMMPAGRAILCPQKEHKYVLSSDAVKFHILDGIDNKYILYAINSKTFKSQVYDNVQGVTRVRTSLQKLRSYYVPIPPYQEQLRIVKKIEELYFALDEITKAIAS